MALAGRHNIAKMYSSTTGTGTLTLTTAVPGFNTFANAGVVNGERLKFTIRDGIHSEVSKGIYTSAGLTLTRATVYSSTNGGSKIECTGRQFVEISLPSEEMWPFASYYGNTGDSVANTVTDTAITLDTELVDDCAIASVASNAVTVAEKGWYQVYFSVIVSGGAAFNGRCEIDNTNLSTPAKGYTTAMAIQLDHIFVGPFIVNATTDSFSIGTISFNNQLGATVTVTIQEFTVWKMGNK